MNVELRSEIVQNEVRAVLNHPALSRIANSIDQQVRQAESGWQSQVRSEVFEPLRELLVELTVISRGASSRLEESKATRSQFREAVMVYRSELTERVIGRLVKYLRSTPPEERATISVLAILESLEAEVEGVPETVIEQDASATYQRAETDSAGQSIRKLFVRVGQRLHLKRSPRTVPARAMAAYHLHVRVPRRIVSRHLQNVRHLCSLVTLLEEAFSSWTHDVLDVELSLDAPSFYSPPDFEVETSERDREAESIESLRERVLDADSVFVSALERVQAALGALPDLGSIDEATELLVFDLQNAGTFLLPSKNRSLPSLKYRPKALLEADQAPWVDWMESARSRMRINWHLLNLRSVLVGQLGRLAERAAGQTVRPLVDVLELLTARLGEIQEQLSKRFEGEDGVDHTLIVDRVLALKVEVDSFVDEVVDRVNSFDSATDFLKDFGDSEGEAVSKAFAHLPGDLRIRVSPSSPLALEIGFAEYREIDLKSIAERMLGLRYSDQVRGHSDRLKLSVTRRWIDVEQAAEVVRFGLSAAIEELRSEAGDGPGESDETSPVDRARELALDGFSRAVEMTSSDNNVVQESWSTFVRGVIGVSIDDWRLLHRQAKAAEMSKEWTGLGDRIKRSARQIRLEAEKRAISVLERGRTFFRLGRRHAKSLIQRGQSAVGVSQAHKGRRQETTDAIAQWRGLLEELPLVYRRLFTFEPLADESHMVNRSTDLGVVRAHYDRWLNGQTTNTLILSGPMGSGRSSFIKVLQGVVFGDATVIHLTFQERLESEESLVAAIAAALDVEMGGEKNLTELEHRVLANAESNNRHRVCIVDNLEYTLFRVPGGSDLLESLLIFFSRTDAVIYWISSLGDLPRHFLEKTAKIDGFIDLHAMKNFNQEATQAMLITRHRKSGLPLEFETSADAGAIMKQRLKRAKSDVDRQEILRNAFFEKLHKESGQCLRLALFYWLRSIELDANSDKMTIRSLKALNVDFLHDLDLRSAFTLKAMLFHLTLTLDENNRLFRQQEREGTMIMESLLNSGLILPAEGEPSAARDRIEPGVRYRVHPLLLHPIMEHLRARHIVY